MDTVRYFIEDARECLDHAEDDLNKVDYPSAGIMLEESIVRLQDALRYLERRNRD